MRSIGMCLNKFVSGTFLLYPRRWLIRRALQSACIIIFSPLFVRCCRINNWAVRNLKVIYSFMCFVHLY